MKAGDVGARYRIPDSRDHKFTRGTVMLSVGSEDYPGAAVLATAGAVGVGAGMVRLASTPAVASLVLQRFPTVVVERGDEVAPAKNSDAVVVGCGMSERRGREHALRWIKFEQSQPRAVPVVIDAGALAVVPELIAQRTAEQPVNTETLVVTPHHGEAARLISSLAPIAGAPLTVDAGHVSQSPELWARWIVEVTGMIVVLKGSPTIIGAPSGDGGAVVTRAIANAPGWTATAGTGDVLAGMIAARLAQVCADWHRRHTDNTVSIECQIVDAVADAVWLHGAAARCAAGLDTLASEDLLTRGMTGGIGHPITALDLARAIPETIGTVLAARESATMRT